MSTCKVIVVTSVGIFNFSILFSNLAHKVQTIIIAVTMNFMIANLPFALVKKPTCLNRYNYSIQLI